MDKDKRIKELESEVQLLKKELRKLRDKLSQRNRLINKTDYDSHEYIDFGRDG
jgi:predicted  nucleic acid-binding Zn-ribbon protein